MTAGEPLLLGHALFVMMGLPYGTSTLAIRPAPSASPQITWSISNASFTLNPDPSTSLAQPPPPDGTSLGASGAGSATLTATVAAPYALTATLPLYSYESAEIGCAFRANAGQAFDAGNVFVQGASDPAHADMYATGPPIGNADPYQPCASNGFETGPGTSVVYHFPYGATLVTNGGASSSAVPAGVRHAALFAYQPGSLWRDDFTSIDAPTLAVKQNPCVSSPCTTLGGTVILFKTAGGRIVKLDVFENDGTALLGLYEVSDTNAMFPF